MLISKVLNTDFIFNLAINLTVNSTSCSLPQHTLFSMTRHSDLISHRILSIWTRQLSLQSWVFIFPNACKCQASSLVKIDFFFFLAWLVSHPEFCTFIYDYMSNTHLKINHNTSLYFWVIIFLPGSIETRFIIN